MNTVVIKISFVLFMISTLAKAQSVKPGLWKAETKIKLNGIPLPTSKNEECVSKTQAKDLKSTLTNELKKNGCAVTHWSSKLKQIEISLRCNKSGLEATGKLRGQLTDKTYDLNGEAMGTFKSIPSQALLSLQGRWISTCKN